MATPITKTGMDGEGVVSLIAQLAVVQRPQGMCGSAPTRGLPVRGPRDCLHLDVFSHACQVRTTFSAAISVDARLLNEASRPVRCGSWHLERPVVAAQKPAMHTLAKAGELSLRLPRDVRKDKLGRSVKILPAGPGDGPADAPAPSRALSIVARNDPSAAAFVEKFTQQHCKRDVSEEWTRVDDAKLDSLRGILAALKEENQATQLLKQESADRQVGQELEAMRLSVKRRLQECKEQEKLFESKQGELRKHVMDNEKSLRLMETNIEKGERKVKEETVECKRLDGEINAALAAIEEHEDDKLFEEREIDKASEHKAFLEGAVQDCEQDFEGDIKVLMNRYHTLDAEKQSLHQRNTQLATQLNRVRENWLKIQADMQTEQMVSSSRLHEAQLELEKYRAESKELETRLNRVQEERELKKSQDGIILMAIDQIFTRIVQSCRLKPRKDAMLAEVEEKKFVPVRSDRDSARLEAMLNQITARVRDLREMSEKLRSAIERERKPVVANPGDEVDILDRVQFVQHRERQDRLMPDAPSSSHHSSEVTLGAGASSRQFGPGAGASGAIDGGLAAQASGGSQVGSLQKRQGQLRSSSSRQKL